MEKDTFLRPINEEDVRAAYFVDCTHLGAPLHEFCNDSTSLASQLLERTSDGNKFVYKVSFYTSALEPILDRELHRWLCDNKRLRGEAGRRSKVAYRVQFYVRPKFQQQGLAKQLLPQEEDLFLSWGAREIQTDAMDTGRWVWTRSEFGYAVQEFQFESLQQQYRDWQRSQGAKAPLKATNLSDFPRAFLLSSEVNSIALFRVLQGHESPTQGV